MNKEKFDITGMTCSACSTRVEQCVRTEAVPLYTVHHYSNIPAPLKRILRDEGDGLWQGDFLSVLLANALL